MEQMVKTGYCKIEGRNTVWKKLDNGKWLCVSPSCSMLSGQYDEPPKSQERNYTYY